MAAISLLKSVQLTHEARITACAASGGVAALSTEGAGSLISADFQTVREFTVSGRPRAAALSPTGSELAIVASDGIRLFSTATFEMSHRLNNAFLSCLYSRENLFWTCVRFTPRDRRPESVGAGLVDADCAGQIRGSLRQLRVFSLPASGPELGGFMGGGRSRWSVSLLGHSHRQRDRGKPVQGPRRNVPPELQPQRRGVSRYLGRRTSPLRLSKGPFEGSLERSWATTRTIRLAIPSLISMRHRPS